MNLITYKNGPAPFRCTPAQSDLLDRLVALNKGGIGAVKGYVPDASKFVDGKPPKYDLQIITRFEVPKLYARKLKALDGITFADCATDIAKHAKLSALSAGACLAQFDASMEAAKASLSKTLDGDRDDAHRAAHDRNYIRLADGVKVNLVTAKNADGKQIPVLTDGLPTVASILLPYLELNKTVTEKAERKPVNSGAKVLMDNIIESKLNARSVSIRQLSLKEGNFDSLNVGKQHITADDLRNVDVSMSKSKLVALLEACGFDGDAVKLMEALEAETSKV